MTVSYSLARDWKLGIGSIGVGMVFSGSQCSGRQIISASPSAAFRASLTPRSIVLRTELAMGCVWTAAALTVLRLKGRLIPSALAGLQPGLPVAGQLLSCRTMECERPSSDRPRQRAR